MNDGPHHHELFALLDRLRENNATDTDHARLMALVINDAAARTLYVNYQHLIAELRWRHVSPAIANNLDLKGTHTMNESQTINKAAGKAHATSPVMMIGFAAVIAVAAAVAIAVFMNSGGGHQGVAPNRPGAGNNTPLVASNDELVEIAFDLPKPIFVGTPTTIPPGVNLQPQIEKDRDPLMAPKGVINIALNKPVTGSDDAPIIGELSQITDGDKEATDGSYVVLSYDPQWVQIDLGASHELHGVLMWHFHADPRIYRDVVVQISDDPDFIEGVTTIFNNDDDNSSGLGIGKDKEYFDEYCGKLFRIDAKHARYIRCYSNGSTTDDQNHYIEIEVYGRP